MLQSYFLITRQNSPVAAGEYKVKRAPPHLPARQTDLEYVGFFFASVECYSAQVDMAQHQEVSEQSFTSRHGCRTAISDRIYCTMSGQSLTLVPLISSKVLFLFGPKQQTVSALPLMEREINLNQTIPSLVEKVLHINSYYILNNTVFQTHIQYFIGNMFLGHFCMIW